MPSKTKYSPPVARSVLKNKKHLALFNYVNHCIKVCPLGLNLSPHRLNTTDPNHWRIIVSFGTVWTLGLHTYHTYIVLDIQTYDTKVDGLALNVDSDLYRHMTSQGHNALFYPPPSLHVFLSRHQSNPYTGVGIYNATYEPSCVPDDECW